MFKVLIITRYRHDGIHTVIVKFDTRTDADTCIVQINESSTNIVANDLYCYAQRLYTK